MTDDSNKDENEKPEAPQPQPPVVQTTTEPVVEPTPMDDDDAPTMSLDAQLKQQAKKPLELSKKNIKQITYGAGGVFALILILMIYSCQPKNGSMAFGICSAFLEQNTPYPHTLRYTDIEGSRTAVRIYFTNVDPYGEFKQEMIECTFGPDEKMGMKVAQITRNRRPVDPALIRSFNISLPTIISSDPYLVLPPKWKNPLVDE